MQKRPLINNLSSHVNLISSPVELDASFPVTDTEYAMHSPDAGPLTFLHYHNGLEIGFCFKGSGIFIIDDKILPFSEGDASVIFSNEFHIAKSNPEDISQWIFLSLQPEKLLEDSYFEGLPQVFSSLNGGISGFSNILHKEDNADAVLIIREIIKELQNKDSMYQTCVRGLVLSLVTKLYRLTSKYDCPFSKGKHINIDRISPALDYIFLNSRQQIESSALADLCKMSETNFRRLFIKAMNMSPQEYIHHLRIRMASTMVLRPDISILEVSSSVGYESLSSFNRQFKKILHMSPRDWRKKHSNIV